MLTRSFIIKQFLIILFGIYALIILLKLFTQSSLDDHAKHQSELERTSRMSHLFFEQSYRNIIKKDHQVISSLILNQPNLDVQILHVLMNVFLQDIKNLNMIQIKVPGSTSYLSYYQENAPADMLLSKLESFSDSEHDDNVIRGEVFSNNNEMVGVFESSFLWDETEKASLRLIYDLKPILDEFKDDFHLSNYPFTIFNLANDAILDQNETAIDGIQPELLRRLRLMKDNGSSALRIEPIDFDNGSYLSSYKFHSHYNIGIAFYFKHDTSIVNLQFLLTWMIIPIVVSIMMLIMINRILNSIFSEIKLNLDQISQGNLSVDLGQTHIQHIRDLPEVFESTRQFYKEKHEIQTKLNITKDVTSTEHINIRSDFKDVCVFYSKISQFNTAFKGNTSHEILQKLNTILTLQMKIVSKFGGELDHFLGEKFVALFTGENRIERAIQCALYIHKELEILRNTEIENANVKIGIDHGDIIIGDIQVESILDRTILGSAVQNAIDYCQKAGENSTAVSSTLFEAYPEKEQLQIIDKSSYIIILNQNAEIKNGE